MRTLIRALVATFCVMLCLLLTVLAISSLAVSMTKLFSKWEQTVQLTRSSD